MNLGKKLKKERENKGLTLQKISDQLHIPKGKLEAIEEEDFSVFRSGFYAKSFTKAYADFLDIQIEARVIEKITKKFSKPLKEKNRKKETQNPGKTVKVLLIILILSGGIWTVIRKTQIHRIVSDKFTEPTERQDSVEDIENNIEIPEFLLQQPEYEEKLMAKAVIKEKTWLKATGDNETLYQGILQEGTTSYWEAEETLSLKIGYVPGVDIYFRKNEGQKYRNIDVESGSRGLVNEVEFSNDSSE
ncbi:MAG: helix-turn-helix domain-containing protein [Elusimicrobiota bacterium]